jgi:hypothetical protein
LKSEAEIQEKIKEYNKVLAIYNGILTTEGKLYLERDIQLLAWVLSDEKKLERPG